MFVLLVLSVMIIAGTVLITQVGEFYSQRFSDNMTRAFDEEVTSKLISAAELDNSVDAVKDVITFYSSASRIALGENRVYYILDGKTAQYLDGTGLVTDNTLEKTPNVLKAMNGEIGNEVNSQMSIMDFAYPVIAKFTGEVCRLYCGR